MRNIWTIARRELRGYFTRSQVMDAIQKSRATIRLIKEEIPSVPVPAEAAHEAEAPVADKESPEVVDDDSIEDPVFDGEDFDAEAEAKPAKRGKGK